MFASCILAFSSSLNQQILVQNRLKPVMTAYTCIEKMSALFSFGRICPRCLRASNKINSAYSVRYISNVLVRKPSVTRTITFNFTKDRTFTNGHLFSNPSPKVFLTQFITSGGLLRTYSTSTGIQKHVSALVAKRPVRKKAPPSKAERTGNLEVTAYAVAEELNLNQLQKALETQGLYTLHELPLDVTDGLYAKAKYAVDTEHREIFFFSEGSAVFWNMPEVERSEVLKFIQKHCEEPYDMNLVIHEKEHMPFKISSEQTGLLGDVINICETEAEEGSHALEKYTFSNALSQAVNLGMWEATLERFVDLIEPITQDLRDGKKIRMSRREVLRRTGELFALRHVINLSSDLLDTPDFYWDRETLEPLYQKACNYLNIARRTRVMNERLSHLCELMELLSTHLNDTHHTRLEWMIIILILVEVVFEIVHYIERYIDSHQQPYMENPVFEQTGQPPSR